MIVLLNSIIEDVIKLFKTKKTTKSPNTKPHLNQKKEMHGL